MQWTKLDTLSHMTYIVEIKKTVSHVTFIHSREKKSPVSSVLERQTAQVAMETTGNYWLVDSVSF